jgi:hypothetical protein
MSGQMNNRVLVHFGGSWQDCAQTGKSYTKRFWQLLKVFYSKTFSPKLFLFFKPPLQGCVKIFYDSREALKHLPDRE